MHENVKFAPIHKASYGGQLKTVDYLIEKGAVIDLRENNDPTALFVAIQEGHTEIVETLIRYVFELAKFIFC